MNDNVTKNDSGEKPAVVMGLGGAGVRIVNGLAAVAKEGSLRIVAVDSDVRSLAECGEAVRTVKLGEMWSCEDGCGADPEFGEKVTLGAEGHLSDIIEGARLLIVVAGLGAGTGTGAAKVLARMLRDKQIPTLFILTRPFSFEGNWPRRKAEEGLRDIREDTEMVLVVHNDLLFSSVKSDISAKKAFSAIDDLMAKTLIGVAGIAWAEWFLKADFATIRNLLRKWPERCELGFGTGSGNGRWQEAVENFAQCPLLGGSQRLAEVNAAVITVGSGTDVSVAELSECMSAVQNFFSPDAQILVGAYASPLHRGEIQITGICCLLPSSENVASKEEKKQEVPEGFEGESKATGSEGREKKRSPVQAELPFQEVTLGIFSGVSPTTYNGENLDAPTFQRRNIKLEF